MTDAAAPPGTFFAELRAREFSRLDRGRHAYLDYTGSGLYPEGLLDRHAALLREHLFGNPHSRHAPSAASTETLDGARAAVLAFLDADPAEYAAVLTANASGAIKLVGESYPFGPGGAYLLAADNHNSVNGIREFARRAGASVTYLPLDDELRLAAPERALAEGARAAGAHPRLFAYPAQSNFSGVRHPLALVEAARALGYDVLLDAAAYLPTSALSLRRVPADFVAVSFYKVFGYPTGVGALVARREALDRLRRPWFAGGTVDFVSVQNDLHQLRAGPERFEDGTPDFLALSALEPGLAFMRRLGMERLGAHVRALTAQLLDALGAPRHANGRPLVQIYGPRTTDRRGGTVAFNVLDAAGRPVRYEAVEDRARAAGVSVRGGCFCNPGAGERAMGLDAAAALRCFRETAGEFTLERFGRCMGAEVAVGAVRASVGMASNADDVARLAAVVESFAGGEGARAS
ncbi:MAG: aminotransferase class V-fold PLP-dependent enzyme [Gemmatimonadota bacterium]|nr:aminotransferase class V-fold PLP-dependent enzyme [Gemmatimonadota bacterium]